MAAAFVEAQQAIAPAVHKSELRPATAACGHLHQGLRFQINAHPAQGLGQQAHFPLAVQIGIHLLQIATAAQTEMIADRIDALGGRGDDFCDGGAPAIALLAHRAHFNAVAGHAIGDKEQFTAVAGDGIAASAQFGDFHLQFAHGKRSGRGARARFA